jgi:polysaccharide deacetylase family protein (PEP-CTERM system associated)
MQIKNGLSIDVEDYFHAEAVTKRIRRTSWGSMESRVVSNTQHVLDLLSENEVHATFFVLGWVAEQFPELVREIHSRGHEIGCHSYWHRLIYSQTSEEFREDTRRAKDVIESAVGVRIIGYRAPSFSITKRSQWALKILWELGFKYDSSIFPIRHDLYGIPRHPRFHCHYGNNGDWRIEEFPISTWRIGSFNLPFGGGGYLRILPLAYTQQAFRSVNQRDKQPAIIYFHPWEIDPEQPRLNISLSSRFRHYTNLGRMKVRIVTLLKNYEFVPLCELLDGNYEILEKAPEPLLGMQGSNAPVGSWE